MRTTITHAVYFGLLTALLIGAPCALCQNPQTPAPSGDNTAELQKQTQNPVSSLISVPIQNNSNFNIGPFDRIQNVLNIQPVIPVQLSTNWNLITRVIQPIVWQPYTNELPTPCWC